MLRGIRPADGLRFGICTLAAVVALVAVGTDPADARSRRKRHHTHHARVTYSPPYAAIVVDANSGNVLHNTSADSLRHPASLTKIMTLYLLFEQLEAGKLRLDTRLEVSEHAAQQAPSKLGLRPGQTLSVEDAIRALVTKSANDAAVVVAEALGGDEETFARMMTRKARALGMSRTVYANASGLPDEDQLTTARDQATLGRAIQDRFPRQYRYFATPAFVFHGRAMRNHNKLLGRVEGVDGIKTGYTRASGFNLVSSVRRGNRHIVAVVMGGSSGGARDARMHLLIEQQIASASTQRTVARIEEAKEITVASAAPGKVAETQVQAAPVQAVQAPPAQARLARADAIAPLVPVAVETAEPAAPSALNNAALAQAATVLSRQPKPGSGEPINPVKVKTITVKAGNVQTAMLVPLTGPAPQATVAPPHFAKSAMVMEPTTPPPGARPGVLGVLPAEAPLVPPAQPATYEIASGTSVPVTTASLSSRSAHPRGPWIIQVGAFPKEIEAQERLREAKSLAKNLVAKAEPFTERVTKGSQELYRARFAGFDQYAAEAACKYLKRNDIACMAIKN
ncbi:MAG: D-alanyl-D-alanine carboxypeptidase [Hyphomicrobiales bacterium]|jgi:D-alanyl-D-alanine carboxypeptidase|nr:D-alanyl-D-alanine carboxypeptidase [Hyphomicrobiales bacterium]